MSRLDVAPKGSVSRNSKAAIQAQWWDDAWRVVISHRREPVETKE
jgi:hypothetical protein